MDCDMRPPGLHPKAPEPASESCSIHHKSQCDCLLLAWRPTATQANIVSYMYFNTKYNSCIYNGCWKIESTDTYCLGSSVVRAPSMNWGGPRFESWSSHFKYFNNGRIDCEVVVCRNLHYR